MPAHLSLFHTLPEDDSVRETLQQTAADTTAFPMRVESVRSLGRGVAFFLRSPEAAHMHRTLSAAFAEYLSPQDRQGFRPHVVVQNKTTGEHARKTLALLSGGFAPWVCGAVGLDLWRYLGGAWLHLERFAFRTDPAT